LKSDPVIVANPGGPDKRLRYCRNAYLREGCSVRGKAEEP
jgi:hypothetical protein